MRQKIIKRLADWMAGIVRAELRTTAEEVKNHISRETENLKSHLTKEVQKSYRKACVLCGQMTWTYEPFDTSGRVRCMDCSAKGRTS